MRQAVSRGIYAYWNSLRGARAAPERNDIDPTAIRHLLADAFLIEIDADCSFPIRLFGRRLTTLWLEDRTGESFLALWRSEDHRAVAAAMLSVLDGATPVVGGAKTQKLESHSRRDRDMDLEILLLPLRHYGKTHSRVLGALSVSTPAPWFGRAKAGPLQLSSLRVLETLDSGAGGAFRLDAGSRRGTSGSPQLIVYKGGKSV